MLQILLRHTCIALVGLLLLSLSLKAQDSVHTDRAAKLMEQGRYDDASRALKKKAKRNKEDADAQERYAHALKKLHRFEESAVAFDRAELLGGLSDDGLLAYSQVLLKVGDPERSKEMIERYVSRVPNSFMGQLMTRSFERIAEWKDEGDNFRVETISNINGKYAEFAPVPYKNGFIFSTARFVDHINESSSGFANEPFLAVYRAEYKLPKKKDSTANRTHFEFKRPKPFLKNLNGDYNIGPAAIDTNTNRLVYTVAKDQLGKGERNHLELHEALIVKEKRIRRDRVLLSSDSASFAHPSLSSDGKYLVFASDIAGDGTGMDLYIMTRKDSINWSKPDRLPPTINTPLDEVFPYWKDDSTLFFSSNGHPGYGGLDVFVARKEDGQWQNPLNARAPLNSAKDDFGISFVDENTGFFSSSRTPSKGKDDIYGFTQIATIGDTNRTSIQGVFEYATLPPEGVELALIDENDNVLSTVFTDKKGNFSFEGLPIGETYRIKMLNPTDDMLLNAGIFLVNKDGEAVVEMERGEDASFKYKTLPRDEIAALTPLDEIDEGGMTYDLFGQLLTALEEELVNITLIAENEDGQIIATSITDSSGYYSFYGLPKADYLSIRPSEKDSIIYRSSVFYADDQRSEQLSEKGNEYFTYRFSVVNERASEVIPPSRYNGFVQINDLPLAGIPVVLFDENDKILEVMRTNAQGSFELRHTEPEASYKIILPDSFQKNGIEPNIYLVDRSSGRVVKTTAVTFSLFRFLTPGMIDATLSENDLAYFNAPYEINGQVFQKLPGDYSDGMRIMVYDENGELVEEATADDQGKFQFQLLRPDQAYLFKPEIPDQGDFQLVLFDQNGVASEYLRFQDLQNYMYTTLQQAQVERLKMLDQGDTPMSPLSDFIAGQIYYKLPGDYKEGIMVYAFDEKGNVMDSTLTDGKGNFKFEQLKRAENFRIQVMDELQDDPLNVALFNYSGTFLGLLALDAENAFQYSKILLEAASELGTMELTDNSQGLMFGQVYRELPGDYDNELKIYAFDEDGNLLDVAQMDEEGRFRFTKLSKDDNYVFRITEDDTEFNIALMDRAGNILDRLHVFNGQWSYDKLAYDQYEVKLIEEMDAARVAGNLEYVSQFSKAEEEAKEKIGTIGKNGKTILYAYRSAELDEDDLTQLDAMIAFWKQDETKAIQIQSHSDKAEKRGEYSFSAERSVAVARYLHENDVPLSAMYIKNWEAEKPAEDCLTKDCNEEDRKKNRRSELRTIEAEGLASEPDYVITYGFNEWRLNPEGERTMYRVLQELRDNPDKEVRIDGFTDTWGSFESNERVSELRAKNIRNLLRLRGIGEGNMEVVHHGETIPRGPCILNYPCPVDVRQANRRVEIRFK